ncbi:MAG TPA: hypothetical protein VEU08_08900 [Vicinamibacterales bacterium]|nr:hypothetical protein [Vicinamibacterales bacterium]
MERIRRLEILVRAELPTRFHWSCFWLLARGGQLAGALASYAPARLLKSRALDMLAGSESSSAFRRVLAETTPVFRSDSWTIDHLAWRPGRCDASLVRALIDSAVDEGRQAGCREACIEIPDGASETRRLIAGSGFAPDASLTCGHPGEEYRTIERFIRPLQ